MRKPEYNSYLSSDRLSGRNDVTSDKKIIGHQKFVQLLKQLGATEPW